MQKCTLPKVRFWLHASTYTPFCAFCNLFPAGPPTTDHFTPRHSFNPHFSVTSPSLKCFLFPLPCYQFITFYASLLITTQILNVQLHNYLTHFYHNVNVSFIIFLSIIKKIKTKFPFNVIHLMYKIVQKNLSFQE